MEEGKKKEDKDFGEGIEVVKDSPHEEKDIEINFGKVLSFFRKKGSEPHAAAAEHKAGQKPERQHEHHIPSSSKGEEEEDEIDLGKFASGLKGMFRGKGAKEDSGREPASDRSDDEISLNPKSIIEFFNKRGAALLLIMGILISVGLTANVRYQVSHLHFTEEWAQNSVYSTIQNDIQNAINSQYPNLPEARKSQILSDELAKARNSQAYTFKSPPYTGQKIDIKSQTKGTAEYIKDFYRDEKGQAYSPDIDPYYWNRYARNIVEKGHIGDEVRNGAQWDTYQLAPDGRQIAAQDTFFPHFLAYLYKFVRFFSHSATLWNVQTIIYPMLINGLTVLMIFLIGRKVAGNIGGFFGSLMAGLHSAYVSRTIHGDNDAFVMFFAILTLWLFIEAMHARKAMARLAVAALAGLAAGVFGLVWGGWWFILIFILAASGTAIATKITIKQPIFATLLGIIILAAISTGLKISPLANWWLIPLIIIPSAGITAGLNMLKSNNPFPKIKPEDVAKTILSETFSDIGKTMLVFIGSTFLFAGLLTGFDRVILVPMLAFGITKLKTAVLEQSYWPNVLTTVAELNPGNFNNLVSSIRPGIFWISALSAAMLIAIAALNFFFQPINRILNNALKPIIQDEKKALRYIFFATLIIIWFLGTIYASYKGQRFVVMIVPAVGLGFGITIGFVFRFVTWLNDNYLKIQKTAVAVVVFLVIAASVNSTGIIKNAYTIAKHDIPIMNDAWYNSLTAIRDDSDNITKNAIITSWWDFGHHFKSIADRKVTFDGTTQQYPQAHWVGKFFMTENETHAAGILRMLDCGSNEAFAEVNKIEASFLGTLDIVTRLTTIPSETEAKSALINEYRFTDAQAEKVLNYTHCENPPGGYVIASEDMIGKSGVWGHFGSWNFEKGIIWQTLRDKSQKEAVDEMAKQFNYSEEKAKAVYNDMKRIKNDAEANSWIAPWPSFSGDLSGCQVAARQDNATGTEEKIATCGNGLIVNLTTNDAYFPVQDGKVLHPVSLVYLTNGTGTEEIATRTYANDTIPQRLSVAIVPRGNDYYAVVASPEQAAGMFTKMFFYEGRTLKHFKLLAHNRGMTGTNVYVYKVDWNSLK